MTLSSPPSPPLGGKHRFERILSPCESIEDYRPGRYHPVALGDVFKQQYKVIRKLGEGSYSTVWLARDKLNAKYVALKIMVASSTKYISVSNESDMLRHIARLDPTGEGAHRITRLLDEFQHEGPNGSHNCLVLEPMGPDVNTMVWDLPQFKPRRAGMDVRYPLPMARRILKQSLEGLAFLYNNGIVHGDFHPGNMLFCIGNIDSEPEGMLRQSESLVSPKVKRLDGKIDKWAPKYLYIAQPLALHNLDDFTIKLSDFGGAFSFSSPPAHPATPQGLQPPETVVTGKVNETLDVWGFGCILFELVTGQPLFCIPSGRYSLDNHLLSFTELLGPLPDELYKEWKTSSLYFTAERQLYNCGLGGVVKGQEPLMLEQMSMEDVFDEACTNISENEAWMLKKLIRGILNYEPSKRPTPDDILRHPWFADNE